MDKETLFKAIQRREVVLWAGAGFSKYAGFPLGAGVMHHLFDTLSCKQQEQVRAFYSPVDAQGYPAMALPAFASLFVNLHNGQLQPLRREIKQLFSARPKSLATHQRLAQIPFIEHIVTTNYDSLFEQAYGTDKLHVVAAGNELPYLEPHRATLYKVHGSLDRPDSILITEEEYRRFYEKSDKLLWGYIESLMLTKTLLFVGYGLEDPNVLGLFEKTLAALGGNMRNAYLVAPNLHSIHIDRLRHSNVTYIDSTGEQLFEDLEQHLKDTIIPALRQGNVGIDHTARFLKNMGLQPSFRATGEGFDIAGLQTASGKFSGHIRFQADQVGHDAIVRFQQGHSGFVLQLDKTQLLSYEQRIEGINMSYEIETLLIVRRPSLKKILDIEFGEGFNLRDVKFHLYGGVEQIQFLAYTPHTKAEIKIPREKLKKKNFQYELTITRRHEYIDSIESGLEHSAIMLALGRGDAITCYDDGVQYWSSPSRKPNSFLRDGTELENVMIALRNIEKTFTTRFRRFMLTYDDVNTILQLNQILQMKAHIDKWPDSITGRIETDTFEEIKRALEEAKSSENLIQLQTQNDITFLISGGKFQLKFDTIVIPHQPIIKKTNKRNTFKLISRNKQIETQYVGTQEAKLISAPVVHPVKQLNDIPDDLL